jgi:16S rRNA processing protein RimM
LLRARGNKGELAAIPFSNQPERIKSVFVNQVPMEVENVWTHGDHIIYKFKGVDTISDAERLAGAEVAIPMEQRAPIPDDEYYQTDLIGCEVFDPTGRHLGTAENWQETGSVPLLIVKSPKGREILIPFAKSIFTKIDVAGRRIEVVLPEGLEDLN